MFEPPSLLTPDNFGLFRLACTSIEKQVQDANGKTTTIKALTPYFGLDAIFAQSWNLTAVTVGDLASTMALAPSEKVTFEFQSSQRKVLEQSTLESTDSLSSTESTTADKEAINIARSSSQTQAWHVDSTATLTVGYASLSVTGGYSKSVTEANQQAINHIHDTTLHSAKSLKALHKIEVRGVSESIVQNRMTRTIANPYFDRTISLNVFHVLKHFSVQTALSELRYAIVLKIDGLSFDNDFVLSNADFLRTNLLDTSLVDDLPAAIQGAKSPLESTALDAAIDTAKRALAYLYSPPFDNRAPNMFSIPLMRDQNNNLILANEPRSSFDENLQQGNELNTSGHFQDSGFGRANGQHCAPLLTTLGFFYQVIQENVTDPNTGNQRNILNLGDNAVRICTALAASVGDLWNKLFPDPLKNDDLKELMDERRLTEVMRRVPGFLAMVSGMLGPLLDPAKAEQAALADYAQAQFLLQRLKKHLECNRNYYVQRFLRYLSQSTGNQAIIDLATDSLNTLVQKNALPPLVTIGDFDIDRTFIDKREVVIPGFVPLSNEIVSGLVEDLLGTINGTVPPVDDPVPAVVADLEVAADGVYLEVAAGACVLEGVPPPPRFSGNISATDLKVSVAD